MKNLYPLRAPNLPCRVLNGEAIIMNPANSTLFTLNETATVVWLHADGTRTLSEIVEAEVCTRFEVDPQTALEEAETFAANLSAHSVLTLSPHKVTD